ncbi:helix-turn-helix transcriptional regulator [Saccharopolyspora sp. WRP15-2]|uniref:Helix-turn-helix transcriptional regulator n=1 Tax=Saccharopolyspora oryzae TaxID=2997343 RepID=A0ABT4UTR5_9PSEU|nr:helix-turn-helix transcriptional regulator [Saccharopolyspora oryzae]MDA3625054.1 helix-turn-helix transcriptional regulator [Saccharopolyspora oryzae]
MLVPRKKPGVRARGLGAELAALREAAGLTVTAVAAKLDWSKSTLSRLENGLRNIVPEEVSALLALYEVTGVERDRLIGMSRNLGEPGWWAVGLPGLPSESATLASYEAEASRMVSWEPMLIPGLLQTLEYSRSFMLADGITPSQAELRLTARLRRQQVLRRSGIEYVGLISEAALRAVVGGPEVMLEQLRHLREVAKLKAVSVRVVPTRSCAHPGMVGGFQLMEFPSARPVVHVELARTAVFLDEAPITGPYREALERIDSVALNARESQHLMEDIVRELR